MHGLRQALSVGPHSIPETLGGVREDCCNLRVHLEPVLVDFYGLVDVAACHAFGRSLPVEEHLHQVEQVHTCHAFGIVFRVVRVVRIVMVERRLQPGQERLVLIAAVSAVLELRRVLVEQGLLRVCQLRLVVYASAPAQLVGCLVQQFRHSVNVGLCVLCAIVVHVRVAVCLLPNA